MSDWVLDASVVIKWFVPEALAVESRRWRRVAGALHAPSLLDAELENILWKEVCRGGITRPVADRILARLPRLPISRHPDADLLTSAFDIACKGQRTVNDLLYLALALQLGSQMVTADQKLFNALQPTPWATAIRWVGDVP
jgi:predicted nucleic acid-binding protein